MQMHWQLTLLLPLHHMRATTNIQPYSICLVVFLFMINTVLSLCSVMHIASYDQSCGLRTHDLNPVRATVPLADQPGKLCEEWRVLSLRALPPGIDRAGVAWVYSLFTHVYTLCTV